MTFLAFLLKYVRLWLGCMGRFVTSVQTGRVTLWRELYAVCAFGVVALGGFTSCTRGDSPSRLKVDLTSLEGGDSLLYVLRIGEEMQWRDTIALLGEQSVELDLDTSRVRSVLLSADGGRWMKYYKYDLGKWEEQMPSMTLPLDSASVRGLYGRDSRGGYQSLSSLYGRHLLVVAFSDLSLKTISKSGQDSLKKRLGQDSLQFAYFMLTPSDSATLSRLRRDSLKGTAFSDTLGFVSEARQHFGISRDSAVRLFTIDTLGVIQPLQ